MYDYPCRHHPINNYYRHSSGASWRDQAAKIKIKPRMKYPALYNCKLYTY